MFITWLSSWTVEIELVTVEISKNRKQSLLTDRYVFMTFKYLILGNTDLV